MRAIPTAVGALLAAALVAAGCSSAAPAPTPGSQVAAPADDGSSSPADSGQATSRQDGSGRDATADDGSDARAAASDVPSTDPTPAPTPGPPDDPPEERDVAPTPDAPTADAPSDPAPTGSSSDADRRPEDTQTTKAPAGDAGSEQPADGAADEADQDPDAQDEAAEQLIRPGDAGDHVAAVQQRLVELGFDPGPVDGSYGTSTTQQVWAVQHLAGLPADGVVGPNTAAALAELTRDQIADGTHDEADRVEVDLARQVLRVWNDHELVLVTHVSTGNNQVFCEAGPCRKAVTPPGSFAFTWQVDGMREAPLGQLYKPMYFNGGIAVHGAPSVPNHPASHGCVRIPMHIAEYFQDLAHIGMPVLVY